MQPNTELDALGRIIVAVKAYRHQLKSRSVPSGKMSLHDYLKKQLSIYDWIMWQRLCSGQEAVLRIEGMAFA